MSAKVIKIFSDKYNNVKLLRHKLILVVAFQFVGGFLYCLKSNSKVYFSQNKITQYISFRDTLLIFSILS